MHNKQVDNYITSYRINMYGLTD